MRYLSNHCCMQAAKTGYKSVQALEKSRNLMSVSASALPCPFAAM